MRFRAIAVLCVLTPFAVRAQTLRIKGIPAPNAMVAKPVSDSALVQLLAGVHVLGESSAMAVPFVRVIGTWGVPTGQECDCITTDVYVVLHSYGEYTRAFRLPTLLDPVVDSIASSASGPVIYLAYGERTARHSVRLRAVNRRVVVEQGAGRSR